MKNKSILIIMMITIFLTGCSRAKEDELFKKGKLALEKHEYTNAQEILSQVLTADSNNENARSMYMQAVKMKDALEYENKQLYDKAIQCLEDVEKLKGGSSDIRSEAAQKKKELTKLNEEYKNAQEERKENAKDVSSQDKYKLEQEALKENQKEEEIEEEQENQEKENNQQNNNQQNNNQQNNESGNTQGGMIQENSESTTQVPSNQQNQSSQPEQTNQPQQP